MQEHQILLNQFTSDLRQLKEDAQEGIAQECLDKELGRLLTKAREHKVVPEFMGLVHQELNKI